jgi:GNAT superfamily N-acetyltransferase
MKHIIRPMLEVDRENVSNLIRETFECFKDFLSPNGLVCLSEYCYIDCNLIMEINGKIIGCHLMSEGKINETEFKLYKEKKGMNGVLFCIHPNFQKKGLGSKFIQFEREYFKGRYDYIWGDADSRLNNYEFWKKNRDIIFETEKGKSFLSIMDL